MKKCYLLTLLTCVSFLIQAQDKIYRKNGQVIEAKVLEVGIDEIKYKNADTLNSPLFVIEKDRLKKIVFADGKIEKFTVDTRDIESYSDQLRKAIKIDFFGPLLGYTYVSYEKNTSVGKSYEFGVGIIGLGKSAIIDEGYYFNNQQLQETRRKQFGVFASAGYKFSKLPDFLWGRTRFSHLMQGSYVKPNLYLGTYSENRFANKGNQQYVVERQNVAFAALQLEFGQQWVFGDKLLIDGFWGLGYGMDNKKSTSAFNDSETSAYNYANARIGNSPGVSFTFGLRAGLLIK